MNPDIANMRSKFLMLSALKDSYTAFMHDMSEKALHASINNIRNSILNDCLKGAAHEPGLFSLTVPTGGGKTLAAMGFALEHAVKWNKSRIIIAIPYTSIIEQTADIYRKVFGEENVLEHHSNLDPDKETLQTKLASENWDAPIIVTTNVQLFESLFAAKTSRCRKLHNIVNSVIILDEAQILPPEHLKPICSTIQSLVDDFECSVVLCTATQPALFGKIGIQKDNFNGIDEDSATELASNPIKLFEMMNRTQVHYIKNSFEWDELAQELLKYEQVLCIVNTRKDCKTLFEKMPKGTFHLSASMCGLHRSQVIAEIKNRLQKGLPVRVISTQLIEAGVDIDFPVVYRALAGLDSIAQAAGRCNREGRASKGDIYVFTTKTLPPAGLIRFGAQTSEVILNNLKTNDIELNPDLFVDYFRSYYSKCAPFDKNKVMKNLELPKAQFRSAADDFNFIDNMARRSVIVLYENVGGCSKKYIELLFKIKPNRSLMRKLQRFTVEIPKPYFMELVKKGYIQEIKGFDGNGTGLWAQAAPLLYSPECGFLLEGPEFNVDAFIC